MIASNVIDRARAIWKDAGKTTWSDANAFLWLSDAVLELYTIRPDSRIDAFGELRTYADITSLTDTIPCDERFRPLLVDYLVARGFMEDSDSGNHMERANAHFKMFYDRVKIL